MQSSPKQASQPAEISAWRGPISFWLKVLLVVLGLAAVGARLAYLHDPFQTREEFGSAQFSIYARNYLRFGLLATRGLPVFSFVGDHPIFYANHGVAGPALLALWSYFFGISEATARTLSFVISVATIGAVYLLSRDLWSHRVGLIAAAIYAMMPLSIYLSHIYQMETHVQLLCLLFVWACRRWSLGAGRKMYWTGVLCLWSATTFDFYPITMSPALLWLAFTDRPRAKGYAFLAAIPPVWLASYYWTLTRLGAWGEVRRGGSKYLTPWEHWTLDDAHVIGSHLLPMAAYLPVVLALGGFWVIWNRPERRWLLLACSLPLLDLLVTAGALEAHQYRVLFFLPMIAMLSARWVAQWKGWAVGCVVAAIALLSMPVLSRLFTPTNPDDIAGAAFVRQQTNDLDLLIGVPPHMAYYIDRPAMVRYDYHWAARGTYSNQSEIFQQLQIWANYTQYRRIILFSQLICLDNFPVDYSQLFDGDPRLRRRTPRGVEPQVWERL